MSFVINWRWKCLEPTDRWHIPQESQVGVNGRPWQGGCHKISRTCSDRGELHLVIGYRYYQFSSIQGASLSGGLRQLQNYIDLW